MFSILVGCGKQKELPFYSDASLTPVWETSETGTLPPFSLLDQDGRPFTSRDLEGKIHVANFFFTSCPSICPLTVENMKRLARSLEELPGIALVSYSVDPERDTVEALAQYVWDRQLPTERWRLVTGPLSEIQGLARKAYFADKDLGQKRSEDDFLHTETLFLVDAHGKIRGVYNGTQAREIPHLLKDIKTLAKSQPPLKMGS